jgi:two-component system response regulator ChvI
MLPNRSFSHTEQQVSRLLEAVSGSLDAETAVKLENIIATVEKAARDTMAGKTAAVRVLFVENDQDYRETLAGELSERGFVVKGFADGASLLGSLDAALGADVIVLDWSLPKMSGIDLLRELRRHGVDLPVVFLARRARAADESLAFDRGAIEFIDKARGVEVLVRRLKRVVETAKPAADTRPDKLLVCGKLVLRPAVRRSYWNDVDVGLTLGEYKIVHLLASNVGHHVTYRAIYDCLRHEGFIAGSGHEGYRANVRTAIKRIRSKFRHCDTAFAEIENYTAFGYRWVRPGDAR